MHFCFWKYTLRNKNRCENSFHFFVFSVNAFEKPTFDDEKNCKNRVFHVFYQFSVTQKPLPGYLILGAKTDIWASTCRIQMLEKLKILQKSFFQLRVESCYKKQFFHVILQVFLTFESDRSWHFSILVGGPLLISFININLL